MHCPHLTVEGTKALRSQHVSQDHRVLGRVYSKTEMDTQSHQLQGQCSVLFVTLAQGFLERVVVGLLPPNSPKKLCVQSALGRRLVSTKLRDTRHTILGLLQTREYSLWDRRWGWRTCAELQTIGEGHGC